MERRGRALPKSEVEGRGPPRVRKYREIGERIRTARARKGLTRAQLGFLLNVSESAVQQWESGYARPTSDKLSELSRWLGEPIEWLLRGGEPLEAKGAQTPEEEIALRYLRRMPEEKRRDIIRLLEKLGTEPAARLDR